MAVVKRQHLRLNDILRCTSDYVGRV